MPGMLKIPEWMRPFKGMAVYDNVVAFAGYVTNEGGTVSNAFVLINEN